MPTLLEFLNKEISSVCPINGLNIASLSDKSTWKIFFKDEAALEQMALAIAILLQFDLQKYADSNNVEIERLQKDIEEFNALKQQKENLQIVDFNFIEIDNWVAINFPTLVGKEEHKSLAIIIKMIVASFRSLIRNA